MRLTIQCPGCGKKQSAKSRRFVQLRHRGVSVLRRKSCIKCGLPLLRGIKSSPFQFAYIEEAGSVDFGQIMLMSGFVPVAPSL